MIKATKELKNLNINSAYIKERSKEVSFIVDYDKDAQYETKRFVYIAILPLAYLMAIWAFLKTIFWATIELIKNGKKGFLRVWFYFPASGEQLKPKYSSIFFDRFSKKAADVRRGAASWRALDMLYHHKFGEDKSLVGIISDFWAGSINPQAIRNRTRLIKKELRKVFSELSSKNNTIKVFSVACGSAEAVIEVASEFIKNGVAVEMVLLDKDKEALEYAQKVAENYGVAESITTIQASIRDIEHYVDEKFDVIEMLGFLDYQTFPKAVKLITRLKEMLTDDGYFLTCNIMNNLERPFVRWVVSWPMIYRSHKKLGSIMVGSGFEPKNIRLIAEPHEVHCLAICKNN